MKTQFLGALLTLSIAAPTFAAIKAVFLADMYGDARTADNPKDAGDLSDSVMKNPRAMESRFNAAREQLAKQQTVDPERIGAVGYCFGGAVVIDMARAGADLAGVAASTLRSVSIRQPRRPVRSRQRY